MTEAILAIDQGTTGTTALLLDPHLRVLAQHTVPFPNHYPAPGLVEHDPTEIWQSVAAAVSAAIARIPGSLHIRALGLTNQRETCLLWDRATGAPLHRALVWQDRRTADHCQALQQAGHEADIRARTGLVIDPYFSATKLTWLKAHLQLPDRAPVQAGTIDSYLLYRLTGGAVHATDLSNAARTLLFDIHQQRWDEALLDLFGIPAPWLPALANNAEILGYTRDVGFLPDGIPIAGMAGDQQAALFGQACFAPGQAKSTYGTGAFLLMNTGTRPVQSQHRLLTTIAWKLFDQPTAYALEGSAFVAGAAVQWLRDGLGIIRQAAEIEPLAASVPDSAGVVVVPALTGLGAPHWRPQARGLIAGLTRGSTAAHIARATLEGIAHQIADTLEAMAADAGQQLSLLKVDGGAAHNDLLMQIQADLLGVPCVRPTLSETTALGAALLAGLGCGLWKSTDEIAQVWTEDRRFLPQMESDQRQAMRTVWQQAVARA